MEVKTFESIVSIDEDTAKASLQGIMDSLHKDGEYEIVSLEANEIPGVGWIATLIVRMMEPEPDVEDESGSGESDRSGDNMPEAVGDQFPLIHAHLGGNEVGTEPQGLPDPEMEAAGMIDPPHDPIPHDEDINFAPQAVEPVVAAPDQMQDEISTAAKESVESLSQEFQQAETPESPQANDPALEYLAAQRILEAEEGREVSVTLREIQEEEERRYLAEQLAARAQEAPAPDPAQSA